ncbi:replication protein RepB, partial [Solihabitans fulvus]
MTAKYPQRRKVTAREAAAQFDVTPRTVKRIMAEPREEFLDRAEKLREQVVSLR